MGLFARDWKKFNIPEEALQLLTNNDWKKGFSILSRKRFCASWTREFLRSLKVGRKAEIESLSFLSHNLLITYIIKKLRINDFLE
jgi:DNA topoisomerase VI subunit A